MPIVPPILAGLDGIRTIGAQLGLRPYTVKIRLRLWSGERPGIAGSSFADYDTVIGNQLGGVVYPPKVRQVSAQDVIASGGLYASRDMRVGPMTPSYGPGGVNRDIIDPKVYNAAAEVFWILTGPDIPDRGVVYRRISEEATALHFYVVLRSSGKFP